MGQFFLSGLGEFTGPEYLRLYGIDHLRDRTPLKVEACCTKVKSRYGSWLLEHNVEVLTWAEMTLVLSFKLTDLNVGEFRAC